MDEEVKTVILEGVPTIQRVKGKKVKEAYIDGLVTGFYLNEKRENPEAYREEYERRGMRN